MIIDTHLHERTFSGDSRMNLLELVSEARRKGLDGICITDHDQMGLTQYAAKIAEQENYPIFVGVEYLACEGDIVAFGIDRLPEPHLMAQEFITSPHAAAYAYPPTLTGPTAAALGICCSR